MITLWVATRCGTDSTDGPRVSFDPLQDESGSALKTVRGHANGPGRDLSDELRPLFVQRVRKEETEEICSRCLPLCPVAVSTHTKLQSAGFHQCFFCV